MRVITGTAKGRRLETLEGEDVRPTTERIKEAVFSIIQFEIIPYITIPLSPIYFKICILNINITNPLATSIKKLELPHDIIFFTMSKDIPLIHIFILFFFFIK